MLIRHPPAGAGTGYCPAVLGSAILLLLGTVWLPMAGWAQEAVSPGAVAAAAPSAQPAGLAGKCTSCLGGLGGMLTGCKQRCCSSPLGRLINGAFQPLELATGGVIPAPCPDPNEPSSKHSGAGGGGTAAGPPGPEQAAEAIKQDQAQAKARCAAVRYLATVPCHYYPEAEAALVTALRADRSECVRWEAAKALGHGCCCTKKTIAALQLVVTGSNKDGNPAEVSPRVRIEAMNALQHCLALCGDSLPTPDRPEIPSDTPETLPAPAGPTRPEVPTDQGRADQPNSGVRFAHYQTEAYYAAVERWPAHDLLATTRQLIAVAPVAAQPLQPESSRNSLLTIWRRSGTTTRSELSDTPPQELEDGDPLPRPATMSVTADRGERVELATYHQPDDRSTITRPGGLPTGVPTGFPPLSPASAPIEPWQPPSHSLGDIPPGILSAPGAPWAPSPGR